MRSIWAASWVASSPTTSTGTVARFASMAGNCAPVSEAHAHVAGTVRTAVIGMSTPRSLMLARKSLSSRARKSLSSRASVRYSRRQARCVDRARVGDGRARGGLGDGHVLLLLGCFAGHLPGSKTRWRAEVDQSKPKAADSSNVLRCAHERRVDGGLRETAGAQGRPEAGAGFPCGERSRPVRRRRPRWRDVPAYRLLGQAWS
jgi:hypothetical protein